MRNPYLLLGVDYGASPDEARRRFARAARRIRREAGSAVSIEDLNWALHEIQSRPGDPADDVATYRVPADPTVFTPAGEGLFAPPPVPLARTTETSEDDRARLADGLAADAADLVAAVVRATTAFDHGYRTTEGPRP